MNETAVTSPIVIIGAGPVGLFCALLLTRAGRSVLVLEKGRQLAQDMRASTFHPATLDLLSEHDGLDQALLGRGTTAQRWQYWWHGTEQRAVFDLAVIAGDTAHPYRLQCEQFHFTELALEQLTKRAEFEIRFGHAAIDCEDHGDYARLSVQAKDGEYALNTAWLIAADGGSSTVRKALELGFEGSVFPKTSITLVTDHPLHEKVNGLLGVNYVWTDSAHYSLMRIRDLWRFTYSPDQNQSVDEAISEPVAQASMQALFPSTRPYRLLQRNYYTLHQRLLQSFRVGRVLFAGDSAHLNSPAGGMGMNGGLHDAQCLVEHLLPVLAGEDDSLLDRYSRRRRTIAEQEVQKMSARNYRWHRETDADKRREIWGELKSLTDDRDRMREFLLEASMIRSRQRELEVE